MRNKNSLPYTFILACTFGLTSLPCIATEQQSLDVPAQSISSVHVNDKAFSDAYIEYLKANTFFMRRFTAGAKELLYSAGEKLKPFADAGNPVAQLGYGNALYVYNPEKYLDEYKNMLVKSAKANYLPATRKLAQFYRAGQHFDKNLPKALAMLKNNIQYGHERDVKALMGFYEYTPESVGVNSQDYKALAVLLDEVTNAEAQLALAKTGDLRSQRIYAHMNYYGGTVKRNYFEAAYWLTRAINNPDNDQKAYDNARLIFAKAALTDEQAVRLNNRLASTVL